MGRTASTSITAEIASSTAEIGRVKKTDASPRAIKIGRAHV